MRSGGPEALEALRDGGVKPAREDLPPALGWEIDIWEWFRRLCEGKPAAVPRDRWLRICDLQGWDLEVAFDLLDQIELVLGDKEADEVADD